MVKIENYPLALNIVNELIRLNIRQNYFNFNQEFTIEEINSIKHLTIKECNSLDGLELLPNLIDLVIMSANLDRFSSNISELNGIEDFSIINKLKIKSLAIYYDQFITELDISDLDLVRLQLFSNPNLKTISGLDVQTHLGTVVICNCPITNMGDIRQYINNTCDTNVNILDINMFNRLFYNERDFLKTKLYAILSNIRFGERIYFYDEVFNIELHQILDMHNRASRIIEFLNINDLSEIDTIYKIYKYIISHITYDNRGLQYREENYRNFLGMTDEEKRYFMRRLAVINSSYSALTRKKAICDGYVNMMKYLLDICGIEARTVICRCSNGLSHSAIKFLIDNKWHYADIEKDRDINNIRYFDLTKKQMEEIYELSPHEDFDEKMINKGGTLWKIY